MPTRFKLFRVDMSTGMAGLCDKIGELAAAYWNERGFAIRVTIA